MTNIIFGIVLVCMGSLTDPIARTWDLLRYLARDSNLPWVVMGDLNNVTSQDDKRGGARYLRNLVEGFNETLSDAGLFDMNLVGHHYTWERRRGTKDFTEIRLDRVLSDAEWLNMYPMAKVYNLEGSTSDHSPLLLVPKVAIQIAKVNRFRFENAWLVDPMCEQLVKNEWETNSCSDIQGKIQSCGEKLSEWGREVTVNFSGRIKECKTELKKLRRNKDVHAQIKYKEINKQMMVILNQREIFWRQRSKQLWLHSRDQNSRYFHAAASARMRNNQINQLKNEDGSWVNWENGLPNLITRYFSELFTASRTDSNEVVQCIPTKITTGQNIELLKDVTGEEIKNVVFQMHPDKSPWPDGMTPVFFPKILEYCGE